MPFSVKESPVQVSPLEVCGRVGIEMELTPTRVSGSWLSKGTVCTLAGLDFVVSHEIKQEREYSMKPIFLVLMLTSCHLNTTESHHHMQYSSNETGSL